MLENNSTKISAFFLVFMVLMIGIACRLTSPTPASWSATPSAEARAQTETAVAQAQQTNVVELNETLAALYLTATVPEATVIPQTQSTPDEAGVGPMLVFAEKEIGALHVYDVSTGEVIHVELPAPIYDDLHRGHVTGGRQIYLRAGSPLNTDELALYRVDLPDGDVKKTVPVLSIDLQRRLVNQIGTRTPETLAAVTRPDGIAWSPTLRYLAFTAALDNNSSDLYLFDPDNNRVARLNGLYTHNATPFWSSDGTWLITQELGTDDQNTGWRSENVTAVRVPGYDDQNSLYLPDRGSEEEVFVGWLNMQQFFSYSQTTNGPQNLRLIHVETQKIKMIFPARFDQVAFDPASGWLAFTLNEGHAIQSGLTAGVYLQVPDQAEYQLLRAGDWKNLTFETGGMFIVKGLQGVFAFSADGNEIYLPEEGNLQMSPQGNWLIAWGNGSHGKPGARLYQPPNDRTLQTLTEKPVDGVFWKPDSTGLFLFSEGNLYHLEFPGLNMVEIKGGISNISPLELLWVD